MKRKYLYIIVLVFTIVSCGALCRAFYDNDQTMVIGSLPEPGSAVSSFFDEMAEKDYSSALDYIENYDSLGFETLSSDPLIELYKQKIVESYDISLEGEGAVDGLCAVQKVKITFLDSRKLLNELSETAPEKALDYMYDGNVIENDEQAKSLVYDALEACLENPELYCTTETIDISLRYNTNGWQIIVDDQLVNVLSGYIQSLATEGIK